MEHYWTSPIKLTFKWLVEKRTMNGETVETREFTDKTKAVEFLEKKSFYINGNLID